MTRTTPGRPVDIEAMFPALAGLRRNTTRRHPRPGVPDRAENSVGGRFLWPADESWPVCRASHPRSHGRRPADVREHRQILVEAWDRPADASGRRGPTDEELVRLAELEAEHDVPGLSDGDPIPMLALAQFFVRDVPGLNAPDGCDLLQAFWCPFDAHGETDPETPGRLPAVHLRWRDSRAVTELLDPQPEPQVVGYQGYVPESCHLDPEVVGEHPYQDELPDDLQEAVAEWEDRLELEAEEEATDDYEDDGEQELSYHGDLSLAPGWKVGGYPTWYSTGPFSVQCSCGAPMELLLTIDSTEWDSGSESWVPLEDQASADAVEANAPTHVTVGRGGRLQLFVCTVDPAHPHRLNLQ